MRPIWSASLSFSLVNIPVRVYSASSEEDKVKFSFLHKTDMSPIGYAKYCKAEGTEVTKDEIVRGFEYAKDQYVVVTDEEIEQANAARTRTITLVEFVDLQEVPSAYFEKPYFLEPDKGADKAYALLRSALHDSGKVGIAKFVMRNKESLGVVQPWQDVLLLEQIRFASQVRAPKDLKLPEAEIDEGELKLAKTLIDHGTRTFDPAEFHDTFTEEIKRVVEEKVAGREPTRIGEAPKPTNVKDLMSVLRASLEQEGADQRVA
jgi:DNA end-binding protein Ku